MYKLNKKYRKLKLKNHGGASDIWMEHVLKEAKVSASSRCTAATCSLT